MNHLFSPFKLKDITLQNRIGVSPMCQYSAEDGLPNNWHLVHLGSRAVGGAGLVYVESTAVQPEGRISPEDLTIHTDKHTKAFQPIIEFIKEQGSVPAIQLAHAGRKASTYSPWKAKKNGDDVPKDQGGWDVVGPSEIAFADGFKTPKALSKDEIHDIQEAFRQATIRARKAGFQWVELHGAHGYLAHSFYSPLSNQRTDEYGGNFENRIRFLVETARVMRKEWPDNLPFVVRLSATDWVEGGWTIEDSISLSKRLKEEGVDLIDCSSGGNIPDSSPVPVGSGYQVPLSEKIRQSADIATAAVGLITQGMQADEIIRNGRADIVLLGREMLRDPYWALRAAQEVRQSDQLSVPPQYERGW